MTKCQMALEIHGGTFQAEYIYITFDINIFEISISLLGSGL